MTENMEEIRKTLGCSEGQSVLDRCRHVMNPEKFIPVSSIVIAVIKGEKGLGTITGECSRGDIKNAWAEINYKVIQMLTFMDMQMAKNRVPGSERKIIE